MKLTLLTVFCCCFVFYNCQVFLNKCMSRVRWSFSLWLLQTCFQPIKSIKSTVTEGSFKDQHIRLFTFVCENESSLLAQSAELTYLQISGHKHGFCEGSGLLWSSFSHSNCDVYRALCLGKCDRSNLMASGGKHVVTLAISSGGKDVQRRAFWSRLSHICQAQEALPLYTAVTYELLH